MPADDVTSQQQQDMTSNITSLQNICLVTLAVH